MEQKKEASQTSLKYKIGLILIAISCVMPFTALVVPFLDLPTTITAFVTGILVIGGPELIFFLGVFFAGKEAVQLVKKKLWKPAGKVRYMTGVVIFIISILTNWICAYLEATDIVDINLHAQLCIMASFDVMMIISLFVMGPEFFIKFRSIFSWSGEELSSKKLDK